MHETSSLIGHLTDLRDALSRDIGNSLDSVSWEKQSYWEYCWYRSWNYNQVKYICFIYILLWATSRCPLDLKLCHDDTAHDCFVVFPEDGQNKEMFIQTYVFKTIEAEIINRTDMQTWKNAQTCKPCLCNFFLICVNFLILPAISFVKPRKRPV